MSDDDIFGIDPYNPSLWQRIKDWWNCKLLKRHDLPIYVSTGVYECYRCDYTETIEVKEFSQEFSRMMVKIIKPYFTDETHETLISNNFVSLDDIYYCDDCGKPNSWAECPNKVDCTEWNRQHCNTIRCEERCIL